MCDRALGDHLSRDLGRLTPRQGAAACEAKREADFDVAGMAGVNLSCMTGR
jgi:hypothetical protein